MGSKINPNLIYDVGMNNGDDTAYYLHAGYQVIAIEPDLSLVEAAKLRFSDALKAGRLHILDCAISATHGETDFWICDELSIWNSFDKDMAGRNGKTCHPVRVKTRPLGDVMAEYGVPYYLKIDIEGHDHVAASDIDLDTSPKYVSMEIGSADDFFLLKSKGYTRFKCIEQTYLQPVASPNLSFQALKTQWLKRIKTTPLADRLRRHYHRLRQHKYTPPSLNNWVFNPGSSGPFGDQTPGEWMTFEQVLQAWLSDQLGHELGYRAMSAKLSAWYDLHATK